MFTPAQVLETSSSGRTRIVWSAVLLGLVVLLYAGVLRSLVGQWWSDPDYGHGFLVPLFSGYVVWRQRDQWLKSESKPANFRLSLMIRAIRLLLVGSLGAE